MSASMFAEIPKLTSSTDYPRWAQTVTAYLRVQKAWKTVIKLHPAYIKVEGGDDNQAECHELAFFTFFSPYFS